MLITREQCISGCIDFFSCFWIPNYFSSDWRRFTGRSPPLSLSMFLSLSLSLSVCVCVCVCTQSFKILIIIHEINVSLCSRECLHDFSFSIIGIIVHCLEASRINSEGSNIRAKRRVGAWHITLHSPLWSTRIESSSPTLSFIALAMQRRSDATAQMVFRDIVSSYLMSLAQVTVQTRLRITRTRVRLVGGRTKSRGWEKEREEDGFLRAVHLQLHSY